MYPKILDLSEIEERTPVSLVGGKALNLGLLFRKGFPVPEGICLTTELTKSILDNKGRLKKGIERKLKAVFAKTFAGQIVAVRSSAAEEDSKRASWAGQYYSSLFVKKPEDFVSAVIKCLKSAESFQVAAYQTAIGLKGARSDMAILVQKMVEAEVAGVMFTLNPITDCKEEVVIQSTFGTGQPLVAGELTGDIYFLDREGKVLKEMISPKKFKVTLQGKEKVSEHQQQKNSLSRKELEALVSLGLQIEQFFGNHQDIEWAMTKGKIYILQARPITTPKRKE